MIDMYTAKDIASTAEEILKKTIRIILKTILAVLILKFFAVSIILFVIYLLGKGAYK
jgi:hypothetical protein